MAKVTGIGGVFFKTRDPKALAAWYETHLGFSLADFGGAILKWSGDSTVDGGLTVWHVAKSDTEWFAPSTAPFMINYRVDDLDALLVHLKAGDVEIVSGPESHPNGKFAWIMDPDRNKLELWEPAAYDPKTAQAE
ncbi:MAG: catechol 2,3-dioxygenase-like lactoylglutathione lyase family enzyme [Bradymonadia bacterium]|jgi:catechol 2,3-dioxygenase-like lactoylglutathione lyase family enzyme